jgi:type II secretory pathway pseudopilin PulG
MSERRAGSRGITAVEAAVGIALVGSLLAVAVPAFVRNLSFSRLGEATDGLARIGRHAVSGASGKACAQAFPPSAPLTPATVPRGKPAVDPDPDPWQAPTWRALDFRPSPLGVAHSFAFSFDIDGPAAGGTPQTKTTANEDKSSFVAQAHGDLDGDGQTSTFEVTGTCEHGVARVAPGMYVDSEVE